MLAEAAAPPPGRETSHPLLGRHRTEPSGQEVFETRFSAALWVVHEHRIAGNPVVPGTTYLEMARAAAAELGVPGPVEIHDVFFLKPMRLREDETRQVCRRTAPGRASRCASPARPPPAAGSRT